MVGMVFDKSTAGGIQMNSTYINVTGFDKARYRLLHTFIYSMSKSCNLAIHDADDLETLHSFRMFIAHMFKIYLFKTEGIFVHSFKVIRLDVCGSLFCQIHAVTNYIITSCNCCNHIMKIVLLLP